MAIMSAVEIDFMIVATPFPVVEYVQRYGDRLYSEVFSALHLAGDVRGACDVHSGCIRDTVVGAWVMR